MNKLILFILVIVSILFSLSKVYAAHYIIGAVNNPADNTSSNGLRVVLWNSSAGISYNLTDTIGISGNSKSNNLYMIDCELLSPPCKIGDLLYVKLINSSKNKTFENNVTVTVTGNGYDLAPNMTLNSIPNITSIIVDDSITLPTNEIDLNAGSSRVVQCKANISESDGSLLQNTTARFFDTTNANYLSADDNNSHYTNNSCYVNQSYNGITQKQAICTFNVMYYANPGNWRCTVYTEDNYSVSTNKSDDTNINTLLSIEMVPILDFGNLNTTKVSSEIKINLSNSGNVKVNLSLSGYAVTPGDSLAMNCSYGYTRNISIGYEKYNLTNTNPGDPMSLSTFQSKYTNLSSTSVIKNFNLNSRTDDYSDNAINSTYWRIYIPTGVAGNCYGNIVFGATQAAGN